VRRLVFASLSVASLAVLPACGDDVHVTPLSASWLEWSDSVTAGTPFGVRVYGLMGHEPRDLRIRITTGGDTVTIEPYSVGTAVRAQIFGYDTLVWVPGIAATVPRTVVVRAPSRWPTSQPPWTVRTFGTLTVSPDTVIGSLMRSVGMGEGFQTSAGCFLVIPLEPSRVYISADQTPDWAPSFTGFVYGRIDTFLLSTCLDDAFVIQVDSVKQ
jgi:hypothetical protein